MIDIILDTLVDAIKILPFLFLAFLAMELLEHRFGDKAGKIIEKSGRWGPLLGSVLGAFPQCGFSAAATNLYAGKIITTGTLIAVYLSTSDEMLPLLISHGTSAGVIISIILLKVAVGLIFGFAIDFIISKSKKSAPKPTIEDFCKEEHCHCDNENLMAATIQHTFNIFLFIIAVSFAINLAVHFWGEDGLKSLLSGAGIFTPFISSLIGLLPNCAASVVITQLYLAGALSFGSAMAGLLTGSGVALLILFKANRNKKENIQILLTVYFIGAFCGVFINLFV